jgi:hypothetical protein
VTRVLSKQQRKSKLPAEVDALAKSKTAEVIKNADGSVTRRRETAKTSKELTTSTGDLLETSLEFNKTTRSSRGEGSSKFVAETDMLGRESTQAFHEFANTLGVHTEQVKGTDVYGVTKEGKTTSKTVEKGDTTESVIRSKSHDSLGNAQKSSDVTRVTTGGKSTVTTTDKRSSGSELTTRSSTTYEDKKLKLGGGADWLKETRVDKSTLTETDYDPSAVLAKTDKASEWVGKVFKGLGLEQQWQSELSSSLMKERELVSGEHGSVTAQYGVSGGQSASIDGDGIRGSFNREARAGIYAESHGAVEGKYGSASYDARAKAEAVASIDAKGSIDANGLDATVTARVGVSVEAEITGRAQTKSAQIGGVDVNAAVEGHAKASAEAVAEATGTVKVTRHPPTAIVRGTAGASAVAKIEGDIVASAGPFSIHASAYASAGAEARASGLIGFEDGKLKLGGSLGAALGVGAGADVEVEIDVGQIAEMAKGAADLNHDGKLGLDDAVVGIEKAAKWVGGLFGGGHHKAHGSGKHSPAIAKAAAAAGLQDLFRLLDGIKEPKRPAKDGSTEELARYAQEAAQYQQLMTTLSSIARMREQLKKSLRA